MKKVCIMAIACIYAFFVVSCVSYSRVKVPLNERCLIELAEGVELIDNKQQRRDQIAGVGREKINYFAGEHTLDFRFNNQDYYSMNVIKLTYNFEAGHHYKINANIAKNEKNIDTIILSVQDLGTKTPSYNNGIYTGIHISAGPYFGIGGHSYINFGVSLLGIKTVFDIGTPIELTLTTGAGLGFGDDTTTLHTYAAVIGSFFIPKTDFGIGGGFGYKIETGPDDPYYSPFWRAEIKWLYGGLYYENYFKPSYFSNINSQEPPNLLFNWGAGYFFRF